MMDFDFSEIPSNILSTDGESFSETKDESKAHLEVDASTKSTTEFEIPPEFDLNLFTELEFDPSLFTELNASMA